MLGDNSRKSRRSKRSESRSNVRMERMTGGAARADVARDDNRYDQSETPSRHGGDPYFDDESGQWYQSSDDEDVRHRSKGGGNKDDAFMDVTDTPSRTLYYICLIVLVIVVLVLIAIGISFVVAYDDTVAMPEAFALNLNIQRVIYFGIRSHDFCLTSKAIQCGADGLNATACNATPVELDALCPPIPELAALFSASGVESALSESTSSTSDLFASQISELQSTSSDSSPSSPPSPSSSFKKK